MSLRLSLLNIQGLVTRRTNKLKTPELQKVFESSDVVLLTETWTNDFSDVAVKKFETYILNRNENKTKSKRNSGGIIVYLRNEFASRDTPVFFMDQNK